MPYFVYKILPGPTSLIKTLELEQSFDKFIEAKNYARARRTEFSAEDKVMIKVMFAENPLQAEELLLEQREAPPLHGDD